MSGGGPRSRSPLWEGAGMGCGGRAVECKASIAGLHCLLIIALLFRFSFTRLQLSHERLALYQVKFCLFLYVIKPCPFRSLPVLDKPHPLKPLYLFSSDYRSKNEGSEFCDP
jgi:hypothetical protein